MHRFCLRAPLALLSLLPAAGAQDVSANLHTGGAGPQGTWYAQAGAVTPGDSFSAAIAGDFDGDSSPDIGVAVNGDLDLLLAPGLFEALMPGVASGTAFATLVRDGADGILVSTASGIDLVDYDTASRQWIGGALGGGTWTHAQADPWKNAQRLEFWRAANGDAHLYALAQDGLTVLQASSVNGGAWNPGPPSAAASTPVADIEVLDWDGDGSGEVVTLHGNQVVVRDPANWIPVASHTVPGVVSQSIEPLHRSGSARSWLVWLVTVAGSQDQFLAVVGSQEGIASTLFLGSGEQYTDFSTGDADGDQNDDIVAVNALDWEVSWAFDRGDSAPAFSLGGSADGSEAARVALADDASGPPAGLPAPTVHDLDGDGDGDLVLPIAERSAVWIRLEESVPHVPYMPVLVTEIGVEDFDPEDPHPGGLVDYVAELNIEGTVDVELKLGPLVHGDYMEFVAWRRHPQSAVIDPKSIRYERIPVAALAGGSTTEVSCLVPDNSTWTFAEPYTFFAADLFICVQMVEAASADSVVPVTRRYPGRIYRFQAREPGSGNRRLKLTFESCTGPVDGILYSATGNDVGGSDATNCIPAPPSTPPTRP